MYRAVSRGIHTTPHALPALSGAAPLLTLPLSSLVSRLRAIPSGREIRRNYVDPPKGWENFPKPQKEWKKGEEGGKGEKLGKIERKEKKKEKQKEEEKKDDEEEDDDDTSDRTTLLRIFAGLAGLICLIIYLNREKGTSISYLQFQNELLASNFVDHLTIENKKTVRIYLKGQVGEAPKAMYYMTIGDPKSFEADLADSLQQLGLPKDYVPIRYVKKTEWGKTALQAAPTIGTIVLLGYFVRIMYKRLSSIGQKGGPGGMFAIGKSNAKLFDSRSKKVSFKDVAGLEEAKQEVSEFVGFLRNPSRYTQLGAKIPKGALLVGPPGTGKTLLAKAMAGEADVPFYSVSGSDFIEVFGGVGPARVRDLFAQARKSAPCIIFLDEIDAIGRRRGGAGAVRNEERENTLNQLLVEMDGFEQNKGIVVLAGTNRPDILDPALMRPGRFDRQIALDNPDIKSRESIFQLHLSKIKTDLNREALATRLAQLTPGFSGADIANVCNEAALIAARHRKTQVEDSDFDAAIDRVIAGLEKKNKVLSPQEKERVAYHEAGHALVGWLLLHSDPVLKVSIIPRGQAALGFSMQVPEERYLHSTEYIQDRICVLLAGRCAEMVQFGDISSGAQDDLEKVTDLAYASVLSYGMDPNFGPIAYTDKYSNGYFGKPFSEATSEIVDKEAKAMVDQMFEKTLSLLTENKDKLGEIAQLLLKKEVITGADVEQILGPKPKPPPPTAPHLEKEEKNAPPPPPQAEATKTEEM